MSYQANRIGDPNNLGVFIDEAALIAAYPIGAPGYFATVEDTDSFWIWDEGTSSWIDSGRAAAEAYVYIAYASDDTGTDFTLTFDPLLDYIAILSSTIAIPTPVVGDFAGLWKNYKGLPGPGGDVVGPASATANNVVIFNGTTGKIIKDSGLALSGNNSGDQVGDGVTITGAGTIADPFVAVIGSGDVVGPDSAVDSNFAAFDTITGKLIKDSGSNASSFDPAGAAAAVTPTTLGLVIGTDVQAYSADLDAVSGTNTGDNAANSSSTYIGTTAVALNRASADLALTGITSVNELPISADSTDANTLIGINAGANMAVGAKYNVFLGDSSAANGVKTSASDNNTGIGAYSLYNLTQGYGNTAGGSAVMQSITIGDHNVALGVNALNGVSTGNNNTGIGTFSLNSVTGSGNVALGFSAGKYETGSNAFYVDNQDRTNTAGDKAGALLYGTFNATPASQTLKTNSAFESTYGVNIPTGQTYKINGTALAASDITNALASGGALGTPSSGTLTNCTGLPIDGLVDDTTSALGVGTLELGHADDTTLGRVSAGVLGVQGVAVPTVSSTSTLTNKRITQRVVTTTDDATAVINTDTCDVYELSAVANATEFTLTGTPTDGQRLIVRIKDAGAAKGLTWTGFTAIGVTLPTTTVVSKWHIVGCIYNSAASQWQAVAVVAQA